MTSAFLILITSIFFILSGWQLSHLLGKTVLIEKLGVSFLLGNGLTTLTWFLLYLLGIPLDLISLVASGGIIFLLGWTLNQFYHFDSTITRLPPLSRLEIILIAVTVVLLLSAFVIGNYKPLVAWDSLALYDFRGHAIALNHSLKDLTDDSYYVSYPLMISLDHAIIYLLKGISAQGLHAVFFAAFISVIYGRLFNWSNPLYAGIGSVLIIFHKEIFAHSTYAYTNLPYIAYLVTSILFAVTPTRSSRQLSFLLLGGIFAGLSTWVRSSEIFWVIPFALILIQGYLLRSLPLALFSITLGFLFRSTWISFFNAVIRAIHYPQVSILGNVTIEKIPWIIERWPVYYWYLYLNVVTPYGGYWMMLIPLAIIYWQKRDHRLLLLSLSIFASAILVILGTIILSTYFPTWNEIGDSARRMMLFIVPLATVSSLYGLSLLTKKS